MDVNILYYSFIYLLVYISSICGFSIERTIFPTADIRVYVHKRTAKIWEPWELNRRICPPSLCKQADETGRGDYRPRGTANTVFFQGDIILDQVSEKYIYHDYQIRRRRKRATIRVKSRLWKDGIVPYLIVNEINPVAKKWILKAMAHIQENTCVRFKKKKKSDKHYVLFKSEAGCWSNVGRRGGEQIINLGRGCEHLGTAVHEIMHALGIWHEQARSDRDKYVEIIKSNISPRYLPDFNMIDRNVSSARGYPYDYNSIMHYSQFAFTRNGEQTIKVIGVGKTRNLDIGQRDGMSTIDIAQVRDMYQCNQKEDTKATACPKGWIKNLASCYKFFDHPKVQFSAAQRKCASLRSDLVSINSLKEERFLESHTLSKYKNVYIWRTGGKLVNGTFMWYRGEKKKPRKLTYTNWDKGQPRTFTSMALSRNRDTNEISWHGVWTGSLVQLPYYMYPFICEKRAKRKCLKLKNKDGRDYRGTLDHTIEGVTCQKWSSQYPHKHATVPRFDNKDDRNGLGDHNYCRNPKGNRKKRPWCYTAKRSTKWQYCDVGACSKKTKPKPKPDSKREPIRRYQVVEDQKQQGKEKRHGKPGQKRRRRPIRRPGK
ncbi:uncharacterized protein LOC126810336 [Patella vulgata]|uniref:uncharacterized protein LOC126810336 n=1 Tax=Patella vulgata TaxID=6465 RepID=UPI0021800590|nr:uncharacterized protein LOC126810336 [Patella vulgata]